MSFSSLAGTTNSKEFLLTDSYFQVNHIFCIWFLLMIFSLDVQTNKMRLSFWFAAVTFNLHSVQQLHNRAWSKFSKQFNNDFIKKKYFQWDLLSSMPCSIRLGRQVTKKFLFPTSNQPHSLLSSSSYTPMKYRYMLVYQWKNVALLYLLQLKTSYQMVQIVLCIINRLFLKCT